MNPISVEELFAAALDTPPAARAALLESPGTDAAVASEVRRLLERHDALTAAGDGAGFLSTFNLPQALELVHEPEANPVQVGRYAIIRRLGSGASGVVYLARDASLDRDVALKVLSAAASGDATASRRFAEEARVASALNHPRVVAVYDIGRTGDDRLFIAMAYLEGDSLREKLARGPLPVADAVRVGREVAEGLAVAHARGIVHRDIKPENIILTPRGACIVDFGIAKVAGATLTRTGAALGTTAYMSPEQTRGDAVDGRSDVWSLGVMLYELLTGTRPFGGDSADAVVYNIRHATPGPPHEIRPEVPEALSGIVMRCLAQEPARRVPSAEALAIALDDPSLLRQPRIRRRAVRTVLAGVALVAAVAILGQATRKAAGGVATRAPLVAPQSIVFLPLEDDGAAPRQVYLTQGMNDEIDVALRSTPGLRLIAPGSVRTVLTDGGGLRSMDSTLGAAALLRGTVRHRGDSLVVTSELISTADSAMLWSAERSYPASGVMRVAPDIRRAVAAALGVGSGPIAPAPEPDLVAYDLYLRGEAALNERSPKGTEAAILFYREALARDSTFARAYVGLAAAMTAGNARGRPAEAYDRARPFLDRALALDSTLASAQRIAGWIAMWNDRDWDRAERHLKLALQLDSSDIWNYHYYAAWFSAVGRPQEALQMTLRAQALDPVGAASQAHVAISFNWLGRSDDAIAASLRAVQFDSTSPRSWLVLGRSYIGAGRYDDAAVALRRAGSSFAAFDARALLGYALGRAGHTDEARAITAEFEERARTSWARPVDLAILYLGTGDTAKALSWLERIPEDRGSMLFLPSETLFDPLRATPQFRRLIDRLGLPRAAPVS
jgi:serine/threonine-protein kinase